MITVEEYLNQPFKTGGNDEQYLMKDELPELNRKTRRWIAAELKKGRRPSFEDIIDKQIEEE